MDIVCSTDEPSVRQSNEWRYYEILKFKLQMTNMLVIFMIVTTRPNGFKLRIILLYPLRLKESSSQKTQFFHYILICKLYLLANDRTFSLSYLKLGDALNTLQYQLGS